MRNRSDPKVTVSEIGCIRPLKPRGRALKRKLATEQPRTTKWTDHGQSERSRPTVLFVASASFCRSLAMVYLV